MASDNVTFTFVGKQRLHKNRIQQFKISTMHPHQQNQENQRGSQKDKGCPRSSEVILKCIILAFNKIKLFETILRV
jgi:hypothetical protein